MVDIRWFRGGERGIHGQILWVDPTGAIPRIPSGPSCATYRGENLAMEFDLQDIIAAPFRMQPGLQRLDANAPSITVLTPGTVLWREKLAVLTDHADQALLLAPDFDAQPAMRALADALVGADPASCRFDGPLLQLDPLGVAIDLESSAVLQNPAAQGAHQLAAKQALARLSGWQAVWAAFSLMVQDDLAVLDGRDTRLGLLAVCVPSHWSPAEKIGQPLAAVHAPVADNALLLAATEGLVKLVTGPTRWQRFVWTLQPSSHHDGHPTRDGQRHWPKTANHLGEALWLRAERQSFIPLPDACQAIFTIRVMVEPLGLALRSAADAQRLHDAVASMSPAVLAYRSLAAVQPLVLEWLQTRIAMT